MGTVVGMGEKKPKTADEKKIEKLEKENEKLKEHISDLATENKDLAGRLTAAEKENEKLKQKKAE